MRHAKRRKLTVEDVNRALRWSNVEVSSCPLEPLGAVHSLGLADLEKAPGDCTQRTTAATLLELLLDSDR